MHAGLRALAVESFNCGAIKSSFQYDTIETVGKDWPEMVLHVSYTVNKSAARAQQGSGSIS